MSCENECRKPDPFPALVHNRPGLPSLRYRIGTYPSMRGYLLDLLDKDPVLQGFTHRGADDPGIALLEGAAVVGDILSFYQELYANEAFLRTAKWPESVADLVRLTGYRLAPGLGGRATFALTLKDAVKRPPGSKPVPITIPRGFKLKAHLEGRDKPDDFETVAEAKGYAHLSRFRLFRPPLPPIKVGTGTRRDRLEVLSVGGSSSLEALEKASLKAGDKLLLVPDSDMWDRTGAAYQIQEQTELLEVDKVETLLDRTVLTFKTPLRLARAETTIRAFRVDRSFTHFGAGAPPKSVVVDATSQKILNYVTDFTRDIFGAHSPAEPRDLYPVLSSVEMPLEGKVDGLKVGGALVCTGFTTFSGQSVPQRFAVVKTIRDLRPDSLAWGSLSGTATVAVVDAKLIANDSVLNERADIRNLLFHETTSPELTLAAPRTFASGAFTEPRLLFFGHASETHALKGRSLLLEHEDKRTQSIIVINVTPVPLETGWKFSGGSLRLESAGSTLLSTVVTLTTTTIASGTVASMVSGSTGISTGAPLAAASLTGSSAGLSGAAALASATTLNPSAAGLSATLNTSFPALTTVLAGSLLLPPSALLLLQGGDRPRLWSLTLDDLPDFPRQDFDEVENKVWVHGNLVETTQGKTEAEAVLGDGDGRADFQTFPLPKSPLTYLLDPGRTPADTPELSLYVDGLEWSRVDTLFSSGPKDQVYIVRQDGDGKSHVQFGDGKTGARLPSGIGNVVAVYRTGHAAHGPLGAGKTPSAGDKLPGLDKVLMTLPAVGGAEPESADIARIAAPAKLQSLGRLVSFADYEAECLALPGVLRCRANWVLEDATPLLRLVVLTASGDAEDLAAVEAAMIAFTRCRGPARFPLRVVQGRYRFVHLNLEVGIDPARREEDMRRDLEDALGASGAEGDGVDRSSGLFGDNRGFGLTSHRSQVLGAAQNVAGVIWVKAMACRVIPPTNPPTNEPQEIPVPTSAVVQETLACGPEEILALHITHLAIAFSTPTQGGCAP